MLSIQPSGVRIGNKEKCFFVVDTKLVSIVRGIVYSSPAQVLRHASRIAPPVRQTKLNVDSIPRCLGNHLVQLHECIFVPLTRREAKRMMARPILKIAANRLYIVWTTLAKRPNPHHLDTCLGCPTNSLRHAFAIFVAIHNRDIRSDKTKRLVVDKETPAALPTRISAATRNSFFFINDVSLARARHPDKTHDRADRPQHYKKIKERANTQRRCQINRVLRHPQKHKHAKQQKLKMINNQTNGGI